MYWIKQRDSMDCGPTCLMMIARHYGLQPDRERLRQTCALDKNGVSLLGISKSSEDIGLKTIGGWLSFDKLAKEAPLPCIVYWNQNHFVVVYKIKKHKKEEFKMNSSFLIMILISYSPINIFVTIILPKYIIKKKVHRN